MRRSASSVVHFPTKSAKKTRASAGVCPSYNSVTGPTAADSEEPVPLNVSHRPIGIRIAVVSAGKTPGGGSIPIHVIVLALDSMTTVCQTERADARTQGLMLMVVLHGVSFGPL